MSIILAKTEKPYKHLIRKELKQDPTAEDVLSHLFGDYEGYINTRYTVREYEDVNTNIIQRANTLWVIPLYAVFIAPIKWVLTGSTGLKTESKSYRFVKWLVGDIR